MDAGYLDRERLGRRNRYTIRASLLISLPAHRDIYLNALLNVLLPESSSVGAPGGHARRRSSQLTAGPTVARPLGVGLRAR